jgi:hypothetical protein
MFTKTLATPCSQNTSIRPSKRNRVLFWALLLGYATSTHAWQSSTDVLRVEEDWEVVIGQPGADCVAPYVTTVISPVANSDELHCLFALNPRDESENLTGGTQMLIKNNEVTIGNEAADIGQATTFESETITWTKRMTLVDGLLSFEIVDGESQSWGAFGGLETHFITNVVNLNGYSPEVSVESSGVGYASYRVQTLVLKEVRYYLADGQILVDGTPRSVHPR